MTHNPKLIKFYVKTKEKTQKTTFKYKGNKLGKLTKKSILMNQRNHIIIKLIQIECFNHINSNNDNKFQKKTNLYQIIFQRQNQINNYKILFLNNNRKQKQRRKNQEYNKKSFILLMTNNNSNNKSKHN